MRAAPPTRHSHAPELYDVGTCQNHDLRHVEANLESQHLDAVRCFSGHKPKQVEGNVGRMVGFSKSRVFSFRSCTEELQ